jgi:structural maintenance of chromosome 1
VSLTCLENTICLLEFIYRKASSSVLAIDERQSLDTLTRDEKIASRTLTQLTERQQGLEEKRATRSEELTTQTSKKAEVGCTMSSNVD